MERPEIPVSLLLIFLFFITFSAQTQGTMDISMRYCLLGVASLSLGILIVSCFRIIWNKLKEGRAEEEFCNNQIPSPPPIPIYTVTAMPTLDDFPSNISPTTLPDYRHALMNSAVLHFIDEEKKKEDKPPDYATSRRSITPPPQESIWAPPSYHQ